MTHIVLKVSLVQICLFLFLLLPGQIFADGIQLSTTTIGTTATFTSQIPADPCGVHKLGETKNRTVVGFGIATTPFNMGDDGVMRIQNEKRADLTDAVVSNITIAGRQISDFTEKNDNYVMGDYLGHSHYHRTFILNSPIEFTPNDSASIVVTNVKLLNKGAINPEFALHEPNGQFCLGAKYTILKLGEAQKNLLPTTAASPKTKEQPSPNLTTSMTTLTPITVDYNVVSKKDRQIAQTDKELSAWEKIINWLFGFIRR